LRVPLVAHGPKVTLNMTDAERRFSRELDVFRTEGEAGIQCLFAYFSIHEVAREKKDVYALLNKAPLFWNTCTSALQTAAYITLGRVFDQKSPHNIDRLLQQGQQNLQIFSKSALGKRKQGNNKAKPDWLDEYLSNAYVPTNDDFRRLRRHVSKYRRIYNANYKDIRDKWFAHKEVAGEMAEMALWSEGKGTNTELRRMFAFLNSMYDALWHLFVNGRKPVLRQRRYSVARIRKMRVSDSHLISVQEYITCEVEQFLTSVAKSSLRRPTR